MAKELMLPPGPDGKAHPAFYMSIDKSRVLWCPRDYTDFPIKTQSGSILPDAARSIAWLWGEYAQYLYQANNFNGYRITFDHRLRQSQVYRQYQYAVKQKDNWSSVARGDPFKLFTNSAIVEFKPIE